MNMEETGTTAGGGIQIISCPGCSQTDHKRAVSLCICVKLIKISQRERLLGALHRLTGATSYRAVGHSIGGRERAFEVCADIRGCLGEKPKAEKGRKDSH